MFHLVPLQLLAHVDTCRADHACQVVHAAHRPPAVGLAETDPSGEFEVTPGVEAGAVDGALYEPEDHFVDMPSVRRGHPGDGTQPCCRVRSDEQLALPEIDARKIPTEEQLDLLRGRQGACRRHLPYDFGQSDLYKRASFTTVAHDAIIRQEGRKALAAR